VCICSLTHPCLYTHPLMHTHNAHLLSYMHIHTLIQNLQFAYSFSLTHTFTHLNVRSPVLEHTNYAKPSHASTMGYFHLLPPPHTHTLLPLTPSLVPHFSGYNAAFMDIPCSLETRALPSAEFSCLRLCVLGLWAFAQLVPSARCPAN
jgi:hypothetical protein